MSASTYLKALFFGGSNSIGRRMTVYIITFCAAIMLGISAIQLVFEYRDLRRGLEGELDTVDSYVQTISEAVWNFDDVQVQLAIDGLKRLPNIERVSVVTSSSGKSWSAGHEAPKSNLTRAFPLRTEKNGENVSLGTLLVVASLDGLEQQITVRARGILLSNGLTYLFAALFILFLFRIQVTRRLDILADKVKALGPKLFHGASDAIVRPHVLPGNLDAINVVEWTLDNTALELERIALEREATQASLRSNHEALRSILATTQDGFWRLDHQGLIFDVNAAYCKISGYARDEVLGRSVPDFDAMVGFEDFSRHWKTLVEFGSEIFESAHRRKDGSIWLVEVSATYSEVDGGQIFAFLRDITDRKNAETQLVESESRLQTLTHAIPDIVWLKDPEGVYLSCNHRFERFFGAAEKGIVGKTDYDFVSKELADSFRVHDKITMAKGVPNVNEEWVTFADDGHREWLETTKTPVYDSQGHLVGVLGIGHDITERKRAEDEIRQLAFYDPLTGLPNRRLLLDRLQRALASSARHQNEGALLYIDLDNFKTLNDTLGHDIGDLLLQQVALRLLACVRESDTVARLGGDEFVVMLEDLSENSQEAATQAEAVGNKIIASLNASYQLANYEHHSTPSIGITLFSDNQETVDELLKRADLSMYQAKAAGRNTLRFYNPDMQAVVTVRAALETALRDAVAKNQFVLYYQAQVDGAGYLTGCEALLRWPHAERGLVSPAEFIPLAEDTGLILPLGHWVLETACRQLAAWSAKDAMTHLTMAVNVSARQFRRDDFVDQVLSVLERTGANPFRLKLELTESLLVDNIEAVIAKMTVLKARGVGFSLDDFGTGYSSLSYLKRLPLDQLKIDQGFVRDVLTDSNDASIARMVIALAESMGLSVIAEGVETEDQREFLARHGCHAYQGYLYGRPVPIEPFELAVTQI